MLYYDLHDGLQLHHVLSGTLDIKIHIYTLINEADLVRYIQLLMNTLDINLVKQAYVQPTNGIVF